MFYKCPKCETTIISSSTAKQPSGNACCPTCGFKGIEADTKGIDWKWLIDLVIKILQFVKQLW